MKIITNEQFFTEKSSSSISQDKEIDNTVLELIATVKQNGDQALIELTEKFDQVRLSSLTVSKEEFAEATKLVDKPFQIALQKALENITAFHNQQTDKSWFIEDKNGVMLGQKVTPLENVGVYIPGGKAAYPSTVLMNVIPAKIAGVDFISIATPANQDGKVNPFVLYAAQLIGVDRVYKIGGAQAIAALAYGTESVKKVDKIVGPGNSYVARAKKWVYGDVAIDMIAGPSEICIVADDSANPAFIAADLLSQAEHDEEATSICITTSKKLANAIRDQVNAQLDQLDRSSIAKTSISENGRIILTTSLTDAFTLVNTIAPEHLQLMIANPQENLRYIRNAGAIFLGNYSPEPLGDYFAGPNHTLPTNGTARFSSPLGVYDFLKKSSIISYSESALLTAADHIVNLAKIEGLTAHAQSIMYRKNAGENQD